MISDLVTPDISFTATHFILTRGLGETVSPTPSFRSRGFLVTFDPKAQVRTREHEQEVAKIMNSLAAVGDLVRQAGVWKRGYVPTVPLDWDGTPPTTVKEALDRIAEALKVLGQPP